MAIYTFRWSSRVEEELTHGASESYEFQVSGLKDRDMQVLVHGHQNLVRICGVSVHRVVAGVMKNSPMRTKRAMLEHLKYLIEEEEKT